MKTYKSNGREYFMFVNINGRQVPVRFHDMGKDAGCGIFVTNDPVLATAIEMHPRFGTEFYLVDGMIEGQKEVKLEPTHVYEHEYDFVKRTQGAIEILVKKYGVNRNEIKTKEQVLKKAFELNISFPKLEEKK